MRERRTRGSYAKGVQRRQEILRTALDVFAQQGYRGSSLREIAEQVGISQAGLLHHFGSKEELLAAVLAERDTVDWRQREEHGHGIGLLDALCDLVAHNAEVPGLVRLFATLSAEATDPAHPAHEHFARRYATIRAQIAAELRAAKEAGDLGDHVDPDLAAQLLIAVMDGLQVQWLLDPRVGMVAAFNRYVAAFRVAAGAREA